MIFYDRVSAYPNRYKMTSETGGASYVVLERADEPVVVGTPLNAETFNSMQDEIQIESPNHLGCYYRIVGGQVEWVNPPMEIDVEYRTTERFMNLPVYTKLIKATVPQTSSPNYVSYQLVGARGILSHSEYQTLVDDSNARPFLYPLDDNGVKVTTMFMGLVPSADTIIVSNTSDAATGKKFVILARYVKDTVPKLT